ncbi:hypothetical protein [Legionella maioricensis]|uniref:AAA domain (Dynein-related subfamily) n=1 Tax=Legionella maioricensis TaxID=2896528 RepID=A0A9X2IDU5_9GAMM|nr:hypothetical protein [Legionella maioricensis]MCL9685148.1 hypothetical protein [Legionella maioricensis]MCL9688339.1 hypothetical protein [Legionella maioricensis]
MSNPIKVLYELGLSYEKNQLPVIESSVEPNGGILNLEKALSDDPECWDTISMGASQQEKKTIILNDSWSDDNQGYLKHRIVSKFIEEGFRVYYPTPNGLQPLNDVNQIDKALTQLTPLSGEQELVEIKKLKSTRERVDILDGPKLNNLCSKILRSPDAFFYFINFLTLENPEDLLSGLGYTDMVSPSYTCGIEWAFEKPPNRKGNAESQHKQFKDRLWQQAEKNRLTPQFLPTMSSETTVEKQNEQYLKFLLKYYPDIVKKIRSVKLENKAVELVSLLNQAENLISLSLNMCTLTSEDTTLLPTSLKYLRYLDLNFFESDLEADLFAALLNFSPELESLSVSGYIDLESLPELPLKKLTKLRSLSLSERARMSSKQLDALLNAAVNLRKLVLSCNKKKEITPPCLNGLTELTLEDPRLGEINNFLNATASLETLTLKGANQKERAPSLFQIKKPLHHLTTLSLEHSSFSEEQFADLFKLAPNLEKLRMSHYDFGYGALQFEANSLLQLKILDLTKSTFFCPQLENFLKAAPNLNELVISKPYDLLEFLTRRKPASLPSLTKISFPLHRLTFEELNLLVKVAPNLKSISFLTPKKEDELMAINWFQQSYPHIEMKLVEPLPEKDLFLDINFGWDTMSLDGNIADRETPNMPVRTLFKAKGLKEPAVSDYHLSAFEWDSHHQTFKSVIPREENLVAVPQSLELTNQQLEDAFNQLDVSSEQVYGQITFLKPALNQWLQLPALSMNDKLVNYAVDHPDFQLKKDEGSGYYFIKFNKRVESCLVNYLLSPGYTNNEVIGKGGVPQEHMEWISKLVFASKGQIVDCDEYQKLLKLDAPTRLQALTSFCRFKEASASQDIEGNTIDVLNGLIKERRGVCRHRAQLFAALAKAFEIDAQVIRNDVHAFVRVNNENRSFTLDLGGGDAHLIRLPMPEVPKIPQNHATDSLQEKGRTKKTVLPLSPDNRFQTWNSVPIHATNADELVKTLTTKDRCARQWLIFNDIQEIEALHHASTNAKNRLFSRDLDTLVLQNIRIENGKDQKVDSPVSQFLKEAALNPDQSYTWFINWSNPKARHVGLNSVIDNEGRNLDNLRIPPNVQIVACTDQAAAAKMGDDFYSRFDAISQAPELPPVKRPEIKLNQVIKEEDVLFPSPLSWESFLIGRHTFDDGAPGILPGALLKASLAKTQKLTLHNAPFEDPKFRFFIAELMATKRFFFNGEWHTLPKDFHLEFATPDLSTYPAILTPQVAPEQTRVVNQTTLPLFFKQYTIAKDHTLKPKPGFFAANKTLNLTVTDNLSEIQWYTLLKEAKKQQCALAIKAAPNVFVPEPLRDTVSPAKPLTSSNRIIIAADVDDAEEQWKKTDSITINVDVKTNFNSLFYHISLKNRKFTGQETALLEAIKEGKPVILKGQFSPTLAQQLQSLFVDSPSLWVNGESVAVTNMTLISDDATPFKAIQPILHVYKPEDDFKKLTPELEEKLQQSYQRLNLTPRHSHFSDLPKDSGQHTKWVDHLIQRLELGAGILPETTESTTPEEVLDYLEKHSLAFLISKTGEGKSHFVQKTLPAYAKEHQRPVTIYHELSSIKEFLRHEGSSVPILFPDEANLSNEHYCLFEAIARGDKELWFEGECYPLNQHKVIFAGNPSPYEGRMEPDLLKRFPHYMLFKGPRLEKIITPLLSQYKNAKELFGLIENYYKKAQNAGLNITARNAQMMCLRFFILKEAPQTKMMSDDFLMRYAILNEIKTLSMDKTLSKGIRAEIKQTSTWKEDKKQATMAAQQALPVAKDKKYVWTSSRQTAAFAIDTLLRIREKKQKGELPQELGINGLLLESDPGLGKSQLLFSMLKAKGVDFVIIPLTNPAKMEKEFLDAFHKGKVVWSDEFNSVVHEKLLNALLSGYDLDGNPPKVPGFCLFGTQNPHYKFWDRKALAPALDNRLMSVELEHYTLEELQKILVDKFDMPPQEALKMSQEYLAARNYAQAQSLFPPPNPRNLMNKVEEEFMASLISVC